MEAELIIFLIALIPVLAGTAIGWKFGGAGEIRYFLASIFALLAALRFWYPVTQMVGPNVAVDPLFLTGGIFVFLFCVALAVAGLAVNFKATRFQGVMSDPVDKTLGVLFGLGTGLVLGGALLLVLGFFVAGARGEFDSAKFPARFDQVPAVVFRVVETNIAGVPTASLTILPVVKIEASSDASEPRPKLGWD